MGEEGEPTPGGVTGEPKPGTFADPRVVDAVGAPTVREVGTPNGGAGVLTEVTPGVAGPAFGLTA